ncbi:sirohydrochlorin cobaltochelatase [Dysgonomonas sp. Marseille-P4677]|uniref:sirohydrochlorin cobaltochelatase n=1 Tax=Dysgonomonas sp. Marseille-P4677 TaxID=2364790 RepID=UPI001912B2B9|nr:sirohydrochlorin cobaltochelatase [Dysgonomonas sp. Marseille-P4677]MBK5720378.1 sirohydrochlorin cobaltochelatase [Dysgonomonas sp. Marseille-P4677]
MKKVFFPLLLSIIAVTTFAHGGKNFEPSDIFATMQPGDKLAILMVHFGTTHDDTRKLTIDIINEKVKKEFPNIELREAYTSRIIIKRLNDRGVLKKNPLDALKQLHNDGYTHILVQATTIINGVEMESLNKDVEEVNSLFKDIRIGDPLLYSPLDYKNVIDILTENNDKKIAYVWVGHGTYDATTAQYAMLDYMLKSEGHSNFFVGTIEGYPEFDDTLKQLKTSGLKKVKLIPFMFVAGEHAKNDIAEDWKNDLEKEGFEVKISLEGLGENIQIQNLYISHLRFITTHRKLGIMEKKAMYQITGEKIK